MEIGKALIERFGDLKFRLSHLTTGSFDDDHQRPAVPFNQTEGYLERQELQSVGWRGHVAVSPVIAQTPDQAPSHNS